MKKKVNKPIVRQNMKRPGGENKTAYTDLQGKHVANPSEGIIHSTGEEVEYRVVYNDVRELIYFTQVKQPQPEGAKDAIDMPGPPPLHKSRKNPSVKVNFLWGKDPKIAQLDLPFWWVK